MPFKIQQKHILISLLCLIILSSYVIVNNCVSVFTKIPSGHWLLQKILPTKENSTDTCIQRKLIIVSRETQTWPLVDRTNEAYNNIRNDDKTEHKKNYLVLWYNTKEWMRKYFIEAEPMKQCIFNNCNSTTNLSLITKSAAVVFCISCPGMPKEPPLARTKLLANQAWIFFSLESPVNIPKQDKNYHNIEWRDAMNWSMTYRLDSDIPISYGVLKHRTIARTRNYTAIFKRKTKVAAWIVSSCRSQSKREVFVDEMRKHGLDIDVYGACGKRLTEDPEQLINRDYKFYLGFENSLCKNYISEKFFQYYRYDTIVVVRGGADYSYLLPNDTFIDTSKFKTIKELVSYLIKVGSSEELFTNYLINKEKYISISRPTNPFCKICEKLNNVNENRNTHHSIDSSIFENACNKPNDIH